MSQTVPSVATVETSSTKPAQSTLEETLRLIKSADLLAEREIDSCPTNSTTVMASHKY